MRWRLKGGGGVGVLPHRAITDSFEFIMGECYVQKVAFGTRRLRLDGTDERWDEVPANERTICAEQIYKQYLKWWSSGAAVAVEETGDAEDGEDAPVIVESASGRRRLSRSHFFKLVNLVTSTTQKAYGALDTFSEVNGRQQIERLRGNIEEIEEMVQLLLQPELLPAEAQEVAAATAAGAALSVATGKLRKLLDNVETHVKRAYSQHMPSCADPEPPAETATCAEHCRACAFGWNSSGGDGSRPAGCTRKHTLRCPECAAVHSLQPNFDAVLELLANMVNCAEGATDAAAAPTATESGAATGGGGAGAGGGDGAGVGGGGAAGGGAAGGDAAGGGAAAAGSTEQKKARETRFKFSELRISIARSLQKVGAFAAHERRAAHEAKVFDQLLQWLLALPNRDGVVIIADWKMKFLSAAFVVPASPSSFGGLKGWAEGLRRLGASTRSPSPRPVCCRSTNASNTSFSL